MNLDNIIYSTRPMTLRDRILCQRAMQGDYESIAAYILARTNLQHEEALDLDDEEQIKVVTQIGKAVVQSVLLQQLGKALDVHS